MNKTFKMTDIAVIDDTGDIMIVINNIRESHFMTMVQRGWIKRGYHYTMLDQEINIMSHEYLIEYLKESA